MKKISLIIDIISIILIFIFIILSFISVFTDNISIDEAILKYSNYLIIVSIIISIKLIIQTSLNKKNLF